VRLFLSGVQIPLYSLGFLIVAYLPGFYHFLLHNESIFGSVFSVIDAMSRGAAIPGFLQSFRDIQDGGLNANLALSGRNSLPGQFILGTLAASGGGLIYIWVFRSTPFASPGWNMYITTCVVLLVIALLDSVDESPQAIGLFVQSIAASTGVHYSYSIRELKFIASLILSIGFLLKPNAPVKDSKESRRTRSKSERKSEPESELDEEVKQPVEKKTKTSNLETPKPNSPKSPSTRSGLRRSARRNYSD
jgi:hypothetical protein